MVLIFTWKETQGKDMNELDSSKNAKYD